MSAWRRRQLWCSSAHGIALQGPIAAAASARAVWHSWAHAASCTACRAPPSVAAALLHNLLTRCCHNRLRLLLCRHSFVPRHNSTSPAELQAMVEVTGACGCAVPAACEVSCAGGMRCVHACARMPGT